MYGRRRRHFRSICTGSIDAAAGLSCPSGLLAALREGVCRKCSKPCNATLDPRIPRMSATNPEAIRKALTCRKDLARCETNALIEGLLEELSGLYHRRKFEP